VLRCQRYLLLQSSLMNFAGAYCSSSMKMKTIRFVSKRYFFLSLQCRLPSLMHEEFPDQYVESRRSLTSCSVSASASHNLFMG